MQPTAALLLVLALTIPVFSGCAAIVKGTHQRVHVTSEPPDAKVTIDGVHKLKTPASIKLRREDDHLVVVELEGYQREETTLESEISTSGAVLSALGFFVWWIFEGISVVTGSIFELEPGRVHYVLEPVATEQLAESELDRVTPGIGTCFMVSPDGAALTSASLVRSASTIRVQLSNGRFSEATLEAASVYADVALLRTTQPAPAYLELAPANPQLGDQVFSIGFDSDGPPRYTTGAVSTAGSDQRTGLSAALSGTAALGAPVVGEDGKVLGLVGTLSDPEADAAQGETPVVPASFARPLFDPPPGAPPISDAIARAKAALCRVHISRRE